jgi:hypothetical protein
MNVDGVGMVLVYKHNHHVLHIQHALNEYVDMVRDVVLGTIAYTGSDRNPSQVTGLSYPFAGYV